ncbi:MAG: alpha/beta hydrolase, partial [Desulfobacteraceae bacterium]|nr:alpha/beta hydrolase [Desulfobacteraceae bacterium]
RVFGMFFAPMVVWWMDVFYRHGLDSISPTKLASGIDLPVLIIHGEKDQNFPPHHVRSLKNSFPAGRAEVFIAKDTDHSSSSLQPEYPTVIREFVDRRLCS